MGGGNQNAPDFGSNQKSASGALLNPYVGPAYQSTTVCEQGDITTASYISGSVDDVVALTNFVNLAGTNPLYYFLGNTGTGATIAAGKFITLPPVGGEAILDLSTSSGLIAEVETSVGTGAANKTNFGIKAAGQTVSPYSTASTNGIGYVYNGSVDLDGIDIVTLGPANKRIRIGFDDNVSAVTYAFNAGQENGAVVTRLANPVTMGYSTYATPFTADVQQLTAQDGPTVMITGSTASQTVIVPATSVAGVEFEIINASSQTLTITNPSVTLNTTLVAGDTGIYTCTSGGVGTTIWTEKSFSSGGSGTVTSVAASVPSVLSVSGSPITTSGTLAITYSGTALPVANGGTGVTSLSNTPSVSGIPIWDGALNLQANNIRLTSTSTDTSTGTLNLATTAAYRQIITGSTGGFVLKLPATIVTAVGFAYLIVNLSSVAITVNTNSSTLLATLPALSRLSVEVLSQASDAASSWSSSLDGLGIGANGAGLLGITNGGTGVGSVTSAITASAWSGWDANGNMNSNNTHDGMTLRSASATLTASSTHFHYFGSLSTPAQTLTLPVANTLVIGSDYTIINAVASTQSITVASSGGNTLQAVAPGYELRVTLIQASATDTTSWVWVYGLITGSTGTVTSVAASVPSVLSISGSPITSSGTLAITYSGTALPVANGGTAVTAVTTTPTASSFAGWDASTNISANNFLNGYTTTVMAGATTTLTAASTQFQNFTGNNLNQTVVLPDLTTIPIGTTYRIRNNGSGTSTITVKTTGSTATLTSTLTPKIVGVFVSIATSGTSSVTWAKEFAYDPLASIPFASGGTNTNALPASGAAVVSGFVAADANSYVFSNGFQNSLTSSGATGTITIASNANIIKRYTGASTLKLPNTNVYAATGYTLSSINATTGVITLQANDTTVMAYILIGCMATVRSLNVSDATPAGWVITEIVGSGTWTTAATGSTIAGTPTISSQACAYTQNGAGVDVNMVVAISALSTSTGNWQFTLPATARAATNQYLSVMSLTLGVLTGIVTQNTTTLTVTTALNTALPVLIDTFYVTGTYFVI